MPFPTGQVGMTPRSYQTEQVMTSSVIPAPQALDPAMMMFAESFKNQCIAMQQYYASHPEELGESPKSSAREPLAAQPLFKNRRIQSALKSIPDQENYEAENKTPSPSESAIKKRDDDEVMEILNRLVGEDQPKEAVEEPMSSFSAQPVAAMHSPVIRRRPESGFEAFLKKFGCGQRA
jgi:hypothetical protein